MNDISPWQDSPTVSQLVDSRRQLIKPQRKLSRSQAQGIIKYKYNTLRKSLNSVEYKQSTEQSSNYQQSIRQVLQRKLESNLFEKRDRVSCQNVHFLSRSRESHRKTIKEQLSKLFTTKILPRLHSTQASVSYVTQNQLIRQQSQSNKKSISIVGQRRMYMLPKLRVNRMKQKRIQHNTRFSVNNLDHLKHKVM